MWCPPCLSFFFPLGSNNWDLWFHFRVQAPWRSAKSATKPTRRIHRPWIHAFSWAISIHFSARKPTSRGCFSVMAESLVSFIIKVGVYLWIVLEAVAVSLRNGVWGWKPWRPSTGLWRAPLSYHAKTLRHCCWLTFVYFLGISMHKGYAFVQFTNPFDARSACLGEDGRSVLGQILGKFGNFANGEHLYKRQKDNCVLRRKVGS